MLPTDKSIPIVIRHMVIPIAWMPFTAIDDMIAVMFCLVAKYSVFSVSSTQITAITSSRIKMLFLKSFFTPALSNFFMILYPTIMAFSSSSC